MNGKLLKHYVICIRLLKTKSTSKKCEATGHKLLSSSQYCTIDNFLMTCEYLHLYDFTNWVFLFPLVNLATSTPSQNHLNMIPDSYEG